MCLFLRCSLNPILKGFYLVSMLRDHFLCPLIGFMSFYGLRGGKRGGRGFEDCRSLSIRLTSIFYFFEFKLNIYIYIYMDNMKIFAGEIRNIDSR